MFTSVSAACTEAVGKMAAGARTAAASAIATQMFLTIVCHDLGFPASALQRLVNDGEPLLPALEGNVGNPENRAQSCRRRPSVGPARAPRPALAAGRRSNRAGVECDVALDLLHDLVNVTVEHRDRAEALEVIERARRVFGAPAQAG